MIPHAPRTQLATHTVDNQAAPLGDVQLWRDDLLLQAYAGRALGGAGRDLHEAHLAAFGASVGREAVRDMGRIANENPPKLTAFDRYGQRIDEVEFHPAYHELMRLGLEGGVASRAWTHPEGGHVAHSALMILMGWADFGVTCPMSMTYAVVPALRHADWAHDWIAGATAGRYDPYVRPYTDKTGLTLGMAMTEKQGGSDVRANATRATAISADEVELTGHKWFCSAPMCDGFLTLAQEDAGLSCFLVPRWRPDGTRNAMEIQRLKDKLGDRSNASSEIEYRGAYARRVGEAGRGVKTIIEMVNHTRLDCLVASAGHMRIATALAIHHCDGRAAFQKRLIDQPAMAGVLADLALESEAALALAFSVAADFDAAAAGDEAAGLRARVATPVAKYWLCKRSPHVAYEAMECHGGAGYVEDSGLPRLFRQSPLNAIWEGSGNVIALDLLRALQAKPVREAMLAMLGELPVREAGVNGLLGDIEEIARDARGEADARALIELLALAFSLRALIALGAPALVVEAFIRTRIVRGRRHFGAVRLDEAQKQLIGRARISA
jgi:putative acyl-CoA dehydrogenase